MVYSRDIELASKANINLGKLVSNRRCGQMTNVGRVDIIQGLGGNKVELRCRK